MTHERKVQEKTWTLIHAAPHPTPTLPTPTMNTCTCRQQQSSMSFIRRFTWTLIHAPPHPTPPPQCPQNTTAFQRPWSNYYKTWSCSYVHQLSYHISAINPNKWPFFMVKPPFSLWFPYVGCSPGARRSFRKTPAPPHWAAPSCCVTPAGVVSPQGTVGENPQRDVGEI